jgi:beta-fructofuranosidase
LIDGRPLPVLLGENEDLELHLYVDGSVIEVFVNQHAACTKRFYPLGSKSRDMSLQLTGKTANLVSLSVWQMSPISSNRLTT